MELRFQDWVTGLLGFQSGGQYNVQQVAFQSNNTVAVECSLLLDTQPKGFEQTSLAVVKDNLAVIPTDWDNYGIMKPYFSVDAHNSLQECLAQIQEKSFTAFNNDFLDYIGPNAKLELIHKFSGKDAQHVHEAPVFIPATNELVFADTSVGGWMWALDVDTHKIRTINTNPPLPNVNGATRLGSRIYVTTNGGRAPGVWNCSMPIGTTTNEVEPETITCHPIVNNYRLNHLNSPNDLLFTSRGNILFTDPTYGWAQLWPGVGPPELATATYHFNTKTRALITLDNDRVLQPNGLALSSDEKTFYIADSNSTSGRPVTVWDHSVRNVYAFDFDEEALSLKNGRLVHVVESGWPDGIRLTTMGGKLRKRELLLVASMGGVDVVDVSKGGAGVLLGKWNVGHDIIFNLEAVEQKIEPGNFRDGARTWLLTGRGGIYKVSLSATS